MSVNTIVPMLAQRLTALVTLHGLSDQFLVEIAEQACRS